jgi:hypothetical protein
MSPLLLGLSVFFVCVCAVSTLVWNPTVDHDRQIRVACIKHSVLMTSHKFGPNRLMFPETETSAIYRAQLSRFYINTEIESNLRNVVFLMKDWRWIISRIMIVLLIYHSHRSIDLIQSLCFHRHFPPKLCAYCFFLCSLPDLLLHPIMAPQIPLFHLMNLLVCAFQKPPWG